MRIDINSMVFKQEEFEAWLSEIKPYDILIKDDVGYVYYEARLLRLWHICLRALRICFEFYPQKLRDAFEDDEYLINLKNKYSLGTELITNLDLDFTILSLKYFDKENLVPCCRLLNNLDVSEIIKADITNIEDLTVGKNYFQEFCYEFIKNHYPNFDMLAKRKLLCSLARYICKDNSDAEPMVKLQSALVKVIYYQLFKGLRNSISFNGDIFDKEYIDSFANDIFEKEESILTEITIIKSIYQNFVEEKKYPLLCYLRQKNLEKIYLDRFINGLKNSSVLNSFANLL